MRYLLLLALLGWTLRCAGETYAVIISGGRNKMYNHERYWNDCAFLYSVLRQDYHLPKEHITLLMADGDNPANDLLRDGAKGFASSPTDLDGDGEPDLMLAATRQNLDDTFRRLSLTLTSSDHLFVFLTDHGERDADGSVHLWLWDGETVDPGRLAALIGLCRPATMNILLGQCYAGAFVEELDQLNSLQGRIITAACAAGQMSWSCKDRPYDEFVYHWTCAIAQHDEQGQPVISDINDDGRISMQEAYDYARRHDRRPETPSITAQPVGFADGWSFGKTGTESGIPQIPDLKPQTSTVYDLHGQKR